MLIAIDTINCYALLTVAIVVFKHPVNGEIVRSNQIVSLSQIYIIPNCNRILCLKLTPICITIEMNDTNMVLF